GYGEHWIAADRGEDRSRSAAADIGNLAAVCPCGRVHPAYDDSPSIDELRTRGLIEHAPERIAADNAQNEWIAALGRCRDWPGHIARKPRQERRLDRRVRRLRSHYCRDHQ